MSVSFTAPLTFWSASSLSAEVGHHTTAGSTPALAIPTKNAVVPGVPKRVVRRPAPGYTMLTRSVLSLRPVTRRLNGLRLGRDEYAEATQGVSSDGSGGFRTPIPIESVHQFR